MVETEKRTTKERRAEAKDRARKTATRALKAVPTVGKRKAKEPAVRISRHTVRITPPVMGRIRVKIVGQTPMLSNRKTEEMEEEFLAKYSGKPGADLKVGKRKERIPEKEFLASRHMIDSKRHGFPPLAIKQAMISACRMTDGITMTAAKPLFRVESDEPSGLVPLEFKKCVLDARWGRLNGKIPWMIYRARYEKWSMVFEIVFNNDRIDVDSILSLLSLAGHVGIGANRPECEGGNGSFAVDSVISYVTMTGQLPIKIPRAKSA